jgi:hypothetical protein
MVRLEGLRKLKKKQKTMTSCRLEPATFRLAALRLNHLCIRMHTSCNYFDTWRGVGINSSVLFTTYTLLQEHFMYIKETNVCILG